MICRALAALTLPLALAACGGSAADSEADFAATGAAQPAESSASGAFASGGYKIDRVKITVVGESPVSSSADRSVAFNYNRRLWGAISASERRARMGKYFVVDWEAPEGNSAAVLLRFEYRQQKTGATVQQLEQTLSSSGGTNFATFGVVGEPWFQNGEVTSWRLTLLVNGQPVASQPSFLWN